jgi:hypothetical protein
MAIELDEGDDTEMNMTPMIDIVFQLIVFFMLTLKFKSVDHRIESQLPKDRGIQPLQQTLTDIPLISAKLHRQNIGQGAAQFTRVRIGNDYTIDFPDGEWTGKAVDDEARLLRYKDKIDQVIAAIKRIWAAQDNNPEVKGEIKTPSQQVGGGSAVPHGDVVILLDAFLAAGINDVKFEGAPTPLAVSGSGN